MNEEIIAYINLCFQEPNSPATNTPPVLLNLGDAPPWVKAFELEHGMKQRRHQKPDDDAAYDRMIEEERLSGFDRSTMNQD